MAALAAKGVLGKVTSKADLQEVSEMTVSPSHRGDFLEIHPLHWFAEDKPFSLGKIASLRQNLFFLVQPYVCRSHEGWVNSDDF